MTRPLQSTEKPQERILVCGVQFPDQPVEHGGPMDEIQALVAAAEGEVVGTIPLQKRDRPHPATLMGRGKVEEVKELVDVHCPDAVVVDNDLTPAQGRNLEKAWGCRAIDRSELILDIFARRAQTRQAKLQVELAQNEYLFPRLRRMWTHLERTEGAIGTRGPGETQLETDRRLLNKRISDLKAELRHIESRKQREVQSRRDQFTVGLVGYTNAGKSTLLNHLTNSHEFVADMPFATLDTRTRQWPLPDGRLALLSDTVGFLQRLPHHLVASFHATLEETLEADLLLHVVDASHPDAATQIRAVEEVLGGVSSQTQPVSLVFNKVDMVEDPIALHLLLEGREDSQDVIYVSARTGEGIDRLTRHVVACMDEHSTIVDVFISLADGRSVALVRGQGGNLEEECGDESMRIRLRASSEALGNLRRRLDPGVRFEHVSGPLLDQPRENEPWQEPAGEPVPGLPAARDESAGRRAAGDA